MSGGRLPKRIVFGNLEGAVRRRWGGKEKEWTDCIQSDIIIADGSVKFREATPIGLVDEPKVSLYGRETDRDLRSACKCDA